MKNDEIIETLKTQYSKEMRRELVRSLKEAEDAGDSQVQSKLMNQIFSYVLAQLNWKMDSNSSTWDNTPLEIMETVFPKIKKTLWFKEQELHTKKEIDVLMKDRS